jgi:hypothetical protein
MSYKKNSFNSKNIGNIDMNELKLRIPYINNEINIFLQLTHPNLHSEIKIRPEYGHLPIKYILIDIKDNLTSYLHITIHSEKSINKGSSVHFIYDLINNKKRYEIIGRRNGDEMKFLSSPSAFYNLNIDDTSYKILKSILSIIKYIKLNNII